MTKRLPMSSASNAWSSHQNGVTGRIRFRALISSVMVMSLRARKSNSLKSKIIKPLGPVRTDCEASDRRHHLFVSNDGLYPFIYPDSLSCFPIRLSFLLFSRCRTDCPLAAAVQTRRAAKPSHGYTDRQKLVWVGVSSFPGRESCCVLTTNFSRSTT